VAAELDRVVGGLGAADSRAAALEEAAASAEAAAGVAARDVAEAEERWGSAESLATLRAGLEQLGGLEGRIAAAKGSRARATGMVESGEHALAEARTRTVLAAAAVEETARALADAEAEHDRAYRHDVVGALTKGKRVGDPCPVCDRPLEALPRIDARELSRVRKALDRAREADRQASARAVEAERDATLAERDLRTATGEVSRLDQELEALRAERAGMLPTLEAAMGGPLPESPMPEVDRRLDDLRLLRRRGEECTAAAASARDQAAAAREASRDLTAQSAAMVGTLRGIPIPGLLRKVRQRMPQAAAPPSLVGAIPGEPRAALEAAVGIAAGASELTRMLREATAEARAGLEAILDRARSHLPDGMPRSVLGDLDDLLEAARLSAKDLVEEAAEANGAARRLAQQLKESRELREEAGARRAEGAVYQALAGELRADRLIDFLQGEALELLAAAGSERLLFLSQGRYRLAFEGDEFFVEDRQNGDERRSVRTLSGGETFLASLALALALSEQIRSLAVTSRARLESLFIDEGFGNLDAETLEVATEALSQLGGQGRMVGVITHVSELAERLPVRVEVRKFPGGSRLEVLA
jgi:exonuclease SbcC